MTDKNTKAKAEKKAENPEKPLWDCLFRGDPRVCMLLGKQKPPEPGEKIRRSRFAYSLYTEGKYLLFHTLTRELLAMPPQTVEYFTDNRLFSADILEQEIPAKLYEHHFLVPESAPESQTYLELKEILVVKEELPRGITHYVILPTTTCNARCFYCFEQGMRYRKMSQKTVEDTLRFILEHKPTDKKQIHIHWFGGEPTCAPENIDRICEGLTEAGIEYTAEMTSNGSLFTEELAKKAAEKWKIRKIQITLDGMAEEYAKRKNYSRAVRNPFETVIRNIRHLLDADIHVMIRLNVDENNLGEIYQVIDFLKETFSGEEKKKLLVYAHSLFSQSPDGLDACPVGAGSDALETRVLEINDYIQRQGLSVRDLGPLFSLKSHYCMVTAPECNVLIDAEGKLFACDAMPENMRYGDVKNGIDPAAWDKVAEPCVACGTCTYICPNRIAFDDCRRQETRKLESELRFVHAVWKEQKAKKEQEEAEKAKKAERAAKRAETRRRKAAEQKEAARVSD